MDGFAAFRRLQVFDHQVGVKRVGVVVILKAALGKGAILPLVVIIVVYHADISAKTLGQMFRQGGFSAAGAAGNADHNGVHKGRLPYSVPLYYRKSSGEKQGKM